MTYKGSTGREFKKRYYQHVYSFRHKKAEDSTKLSSYIQNKNFDESNILKNLKWEILHEIFHEIQVSLKLAGHPAIATVFCCTEHTLCKLITRKTRLSLWYKKP